MNYLAETGWQQRAKSIAGVVTIHAMIGYALFSGMGMEVAKTVTAGFTVINVTPPLPPEPAPAEQPAKSIKEAASPENLNAAPTQIVAPVPEIKLKIESPVIAAPVAGPGEEARLVLPIRPGRVPAAGVRVMATAVVVLSLVRAMFPGQSAARISRDRFGNPGIGAMWWPISPSAPMAGQATAGFTNPVVTPLSMPPLAS
ncbi:hypothetical protein [Sphingopyxis sp. BSNA05]|uniref:hypothetical protein n=1 Tax=Sphingopyxis sp. BSNA05 TaxID=1236614 RepID=UPI001565FE38|nr:hypothetical protein [Sphingopyxis sp. BSNA05]